MKAVPFNGIVANFSGLFSHFFFAAMRRSFRIKSTKTILLGAFCFLPALHFTHVPIK